MGGRFNAEGGPFLSQPGFDFWHLFFPTTGGF